MMEPEKGKRAIALTLRYGSLISTLVMTLGLVLMVARGSAPRLMTATRIRAATILEGLVRFDPAALIEFGIVLLLLTPIFRILVAVISFALERDYKFVLISLGVLAIVLFSISLAVEM